MRTTKLGLGMLSALTLLLCSCASNVTPSSPVVTQPVKVDRPAPPPPNYAARLPQTYRTGGDRVILIDPNVHAWGAYEPNGSLVRAGLATAGSSWCPDIKRPCKTKSGSFRVFSLGNASCKSSIYPLPKGGAPMPYCMFFNRNQGLHGSYNAAVIEGNISHGCVRVRVSDAEWLRYNFVGMGTKVVVRPY